MGRTKLEKPEFDFSERSDRVTLKLEVGQVVYIPGAADIRNENTNQEKATAVSKEDKIIEVYQAEWKYFFSKSR